MICDRTIVCIASSWDYDPTSKHQIMKILARRNMVVWVNHHGTRRPKATIADCRAVGSVLRRVARGVQHVNHNMVQVTPVVIPGASAAACRTFNRRMLVSCIRRGLRALRGARQRPIQVWSFAPDVPYLVGALGEERFVYYCVDEFSEFEGVDRRRIQSVEVELLESADVVIASSERLQQSKSPIRPDIALVRHGVDYDHFATAWRTSLETPTDLADIAQPIFGFFGLIHHWIDRALLAEVARLRPSYSFVLIGECADDVAMLESRPNVHLLGRRPYAALPAYCRAFTAGLMPFARTKLTEHVNPIKMREYLAAGLPVISTPLPEARLYPQAVTVVDTPEQFAEACDREVRRAGTDRTATIAGLVASESWVSVVERLSEIVGPATLASVHRDRGNTVIAGQASAPSSILLPGVAGKRAAYEQPITTVPLQHD